MSFQKREPAEPDILCEVEEGFVAFEMVEIIDESLAERTYDQVHLQRLVADVYVNLGYSGRTSRLLRTAARADDWAWSELQSLTEA